MSFKYYQVISIQTNHKILSSNFAHLLTTPNLICKNKQKKPTFHSFSRKKEQNNSFVRIIHKSFHWGFSLQQ